MPKKTATFLGRVNHDSASGVQNLYRMDPPLDGYDFYDEGALAHEYVVASSASLGKWGAEVYLFPANADGEITDWGELPGSIKGTLRHEDALAEAGYEVA